MSRDARKIGRTRTDSLPPSSFLANDFARASHKYTKANLNFKANHVLLAKDSALARRQNDVFTKAQTMEQRKLAKRSKSQRADPARRRARRDTLDKRASSGSVGLTDYFSGGQDAAYYGAIGIGSPAQTFSESHRMARRSKRTLTIGRPDRCHL